MAGLVNREGLCNLNRMFMASGTVFALTLKCLYSGSRGELENLSSHGSVNRWSGSAL
jgi:hypothetical protein